MSSSSRKMLQAAAGSAGGGSFYPYTIDNSARFVGSDNAYLSKTFSTTPDSRTTCTISVWVKLTGKGNGYNVNFLWGTANNWEAGAFAEPSNSVGWRANQIRVTGMTSTQPTLRTTSVYRDYSGWFNFITVWDSTNATAADRQRLYINGVRLTDFDQQVTASLNQQLVEWLSTTGATNIGISGGSTVQSFDGYMADFVCLDGTAASPTDLGEDKNGVWVPKDPSGLTFGTNGFYLDFADSANLGNDVSGNGNDFTSSGLTSTDQMIDTPTNNFATFSPLTVLTSPNPTYSEGNLTGAGSSGYYNEAATALLPESGLWYWETRVNSLATDMGIGVQETGVNSVAFWFYLFNGNKYSTAGSAAYGSSYTAGDIIGVLYDADGGDITFYKNGVSQGVAYTGGLRRCHPTWYTYGGTSITLNFGQNGTFNGTVTAGNNSDANGIGDFKYTVPTGALALCTANLPEPTLGPNSAENVTDYFAPALYTGNGTAIGSGGKAVSVGFQPDFTWIKNRDAADNHMVFDAVRGVTNYISANTNTAEATDTQSLSTFDTDGFTLGNNVAVNTSGEDYVAWNWKETAGFFDIVQSTGTGSARTIAHNLGVKPNFIWAKNLNDISSQQVYVDGGQVSDPETDFYALDESIAVQDNPGAWNDTAPTDSVFSVGTYNSVNGSGDPIIYYLFSNMEGVCKVGYYTGNGSTTAGPFIYTGFRPAWVMIKRNDSANSWYIHDTSRDTYNGAYHLLYTDGSAAEVTYGVSLDILSNGFKLQTAGSPYPNGFNASGGSYIFMAFSEMPFKYSNAR